MDIKLNITGDVDVTNGELTLLEGVDSVRQHWQIRNKFFLGEYFLDQRLGVAYYQTILKKGASLDVVRHIFRRVAVDTPGIESVSLFTLELDRATRRLSIAVEGKLEPDLAEGDPNFRFEYDEFIIPDQVLD